MAPLLGWSTDRVADEIAHCRSRRASDLASLTAAAVPASET
jgi:hypothetical protein